jgi:hypothetical protein
MKRNDYIKSLQAIKKQLIFTKNTDKSFSLHAYKESNPTTCSCVDSDGVQKYLYSSKEDLVYLLSSNHIKLQSYHCPYEKGWHLTKG